MTLPAQPDKVPRPALLVCPDCGGAVSVREEGDLAYLVFSCVVGHAYSATTLIAGKEERLEATLWSAVYLIEELAGLLVDLADRPLLIGGPSEWPSARRRIERLQAHGQRLRQILDENEKIGLLAASSAESRPA